MKRFTTILLVTIGIHLKMNSQVNLVPNPSFEMHTTCPNLQMELSKAVPWFQPNTVWGSVLIGSTDLFDSCSTTVGVPNNYFGYQLAHTGSSYAGFLGYVNDTANHQREYLEAKLITSLEAGKKYRVSFYVVLSNCCDGHAISSLGLYFSQDSLLYSDVDKQNIPVIPQVENSDGNYLSDSVNWMLIERQYTATGGENFITIGNFRTNFNTPAIPTGSGQYDSYYYIDDISVICTDCETEEIFIPTVTVADQYLHIKGLNGNAQLKLFDAVGHLVLEEDNYANDQTLIRLNTGLYFYYLQLSNGEVYKGKIYVLQ